MPKMPIPEIVEKLEILKAMIEWDFSLEFQIALDAAIEVLNGQSESTDRKETEQA